MTTIQNIEKYIKTINSHEELGMIGAMLRTRGKQLEAELIKSFHVGDPIFLENNERKWVQGKVTGINRATLNAEDEKGIQWTLSPKFVRKL
jgi:hypothetical protein